MTADDFIPYGRQSVDDEDVAAVVAALRSDWLTTGPAVDAFEQALSQCTGGHAVVAVNSGTAALEAAYAAARVGPGDEVVTTPLTFAATATAAAHRGARVRFADVDDDTLLLDPNAAASMVSSKTRAIVPVDYAGQVPDMDAFQQIATSAGITLIEDAAHSIGSTYRGRPVGDLADMTTFSFHPVKTITTAEGGAVVSRDDGHAEALRRFRNHGLVRHPTEQVDHQGGWHQEIHELGHNLRLPDVLAALGTSQLNKLERFSLARRQVARRYYEALKDNDGLRLLATSEGCEPVWHLFPVRVLGGRRKLVYDHLRAAGIGVQVHYLPVHHHPVFARLGYEKGTCPVAEAAYEELLSLPIYPQLSGREQDRVVDELLRAVQSA